MNILGWTIGGLGGGDLGRIWEWCWMPWSIGASGSGGVTGEAGRCGSTNASLDLERHLFDCTRSTRIHTWIASDLNRDLNISLKTTSTQSYSYRIVAVQQPLWQLYQASGEARTWLFTGMTYGTVLLTFCGVTFAGDDGGGGVDTVGREGAMVRGVSTRAVVICNVTLQGKSSELIKYVPTVELSYLSLVGNLGLQYSWVGFHSKFLIDT